MFKRLAIVLSCLLLITALPVTAQDEDDSTTIDPELQAVIDDLNQYTTSFRGLDILTPIDVDFPTVADLRDYLNETFEEEFTDEFITDAMNFYVVFDFLPADYDLFNELLDLYSAQVAGFYDPETDDMNVILLSGRQPTTDLPFLERTTYVHEFVHALQDQHFDLTSYLEAGDPENNDQQLARLALVEGDATTVMNEYTIAAAEANPVGTLLQLGIAAAQSPQIIALPPDTPAIFEAELLYPYLAGESFVRAIFQNGGWSAVNAAYANPPSTTEHIYRPETYFAGEVALDVPMIDLTSSLGDDWTQVADGRFGEFYLRQYLAQALTNADVERAASGWGGDAYQIYQDANGDLAYRLDIRWDDATEADEFNALFAVYLTEKYGVTGEQISTPTCWSGTSAAVCVITTPTGTEISYAPTLETARLMAGEG
jgi:hypothetical protein